MAKRRARRRFSPTTPGFSSEGSFNKYIRRRAGAQIRPDIQDVNQRIRGARGAHTTRNNELMQWYGFDKAAAGAENDRMTKAMNSIVGGVHGGGADAQAGLAAALRQSQDANSVAAQGLGVENPGMDPNLANSLAAYAGGGDMSLAGSAAGQLGRSAADIGIAGTAGRQAGTEEQARYKNEYDTLSKERSGIRARLPEIIEQVRAAAIQEQLAMEQQGLAEDQFGETKRSNKVNENLSQQQQDLATDQFGETVKQNKRQYSIDRGNLKLAHNQLQADIDKNKGTTGEDHAKARAAKFDAATQWLDGYMKPGDADMKYNANGKKVVAPKKWRSNRNFGATLSQIQRRFGMGEPLALRVMLLSPIAEWRAKAKKMLDDVRAVNYNQGKPHSGGPSVLNPHH